MHKLNDAEANAAYLVQGKDCKSCSFFLNWGNSIYMLIGIYMYVCVRVYSKYVCMFRHLELKYSANNL